MERKIGGWLLVAIGLMFSYIFAWSVPGDQVGASLIGGFVQGIGVATILDLF